MSLPQQLNSKMDQQAERDVQAFRFRVRHDHILRQRLRAAKLKAVQEVAQSLGYEFSPEDFLSGKKKSK